MRPRPALAAVAMVLLAGCTTSGPTGADPSGSDGNIASPATAGAPVDPSAMGGNGSGADVQPVPASPSHAAHPTPEDILDRCRSQPLLRDCVEGSLQEVVRENGAKVAFEILEGILARDAGLNVTQRALGYSLGRTAWEADPSVSMIPQECPRTLDDSCTRGAFASFYTTPGSLDGAAPCAALTTLQERLCSHAAGHGLALAFGFDLGKAAGTCAAFATLDSQRACLVGIFDEHIAAYIDDVSGRPHHTASEAGEFSFDEADPESPCRTFTGEALAACWTSQPTFLMYLNGGDAPDAASVCPTGDRSGYACLLGIGRSLPRGTPLSVCATVDRDMEPCARGILRQTLWADGSPQGAAMQCVAEVDLKAACYRALGAELAALGGEDAVVEGCRFAEPDLEASCREGAERGTYGL